jgi:beta-xylosidase
MKNPLDRQIIMACGMILTSLFASTVLASSHVTDFVAADPFILNVDGVFHLITTNNGGRNIPMRTSRDLEHWVLVGDVMPQLPAWAEKGFTWAPEIIHYEDLYWLFYTGRAKDTELPCIGLAWARQITGPYFGDPRPLLCADGLGGAIDPSPLLEDGGMFLLWKANGNRLKLPSKIMLSEVDLVERRILGQPTPLIGNSDDWEGISVEAPTLFRFQGLYYLFYSGSMFHTPRYAIGYAVSQSLRGPYMKHADNPIVVSNEERVAPGHQSIFADNDGKLWIAFHAYPRRIKGSKRTTDFALLGTPVRDARLVREKNWVVVYPALVNSAEQMGN